MYRAYNCRQRVLQKMSWINGRAGKCDCWRHLMTPSWKSRSYLNLFVKVFVRLTKVLPLVKKNVINWVIMTTHLIIMSCTSQQTTHIKPGKETWSVKHWTDGWKHTIHGAKGKDIQNKTKAILKHTRDMHRNWRFINDEANTLTRIRQHFWSWQRL